MVVPGCDNEPGVMMFVYYASFALLVGPHISSSAVFVCSSVVTDLAGGPSSRVLMGCAAR
jgi:hypothetical protein